MWQRNVQFNRLLSYSITYNDSQSSFNQNIYDARQQIKANQNNLLTIYNIKIISTTNLPWNKNRVFYIAR